MRWPSSSNDHFAAVSHDLPAGNQGHLCNGAEQSSRGLGPKLPTAILKWSVAVEGHGLAPVKPRSLNLMIQLVASAIVFKMRFLLTLAKIGLFHL